MGAITSAVIAASLSAASAVGGAATAVGSSIAAGASAIGATGVASGVGSFAAGGASSLGAGSLLSSGIGAAATAGAYGALGYGAVEAFGAAKDVLLPDIPMPETPPTKMIGSEGVRNQTMQRDSGVKTKAIIAKNRTKSSDMTLGGSRQTLA